MAEIAERPKGSHRNPGRQTATKTSAAKTASKVARTAKTKMIGHFEPKLNAARVQAVMSAAERSGLLKEKSGRIGGRVSPRLVRKAKASTGIKTDTDLIEFALASVALEDRFAEAFKAVRGSVDPDLDLGF